MLNGVREAIELTRALRAAWPGGAVLTIIGFCQQPACCASCKPGRRPNAPGSRWWAGPNWCRTPRIVAEVGRAHLGLLPYQPHPSTARCRPTKLFEYLAHGLPVLVPANPLWAGVVQAHGAGWW
ncbi:MAG: hypothetical protein WKG07_18200 [Hymenobacter sp.]